jgi:protein-S-isoprenylcysteine O-methyltransferase Ste14
MPNLELKIQPPIVGILTALAMIGATLLGQLPLPLPLLWRLPCAIIMFGAALVIGIICKRQFDRRNTTWLPMEPKKTTVLVTDGIYRYTRNPMYLAGTLFLLGVAVALGDILALALVPCFIPNYSYQLPETGLIVVSISCRS